MVQVYRRDRVLRVAAGSLMHGRSEAATSNIKILLSISKGKIRRREREGKRERERNLRRKLARAAAFAGNLMIPRTRAPLTRETREIMMKALRERMQSPALHGVFCRGTT